MPTFSVSGKRQQSITATFVCTDDDPAPAIAMFRARYPGTTGIKATRRKDVTVITAAPAVEEIKAVKKFAAVVGTSKKKKKAGKK